MHAVQDSKEDVMAGRSEALAKKFEAKVAEATAVFEKLSDADWKKVTTAEKWPVGVTAHHIASAHAGPARRGRQVTARACDACEKRFRAMRPWRWRDETRARRPHRWRRSRVLGRK